jgi:prolyl oligopeptidase
MAIVYPSSVGNSLIVDLADGTTYEDEFGGLEQKSPNRDAWIREQNASTDRILDSIPERERIQGGLEELLKFDDIQKRTVGGNTLFFTKRKVGEQQYSICALSLDGGEERVLFDTNCFDPEGRHSIGQLFSNSDGTLLAYELVKDGGEFPELCVMNTVNNQVVDRIPITYCAYPSWAPDNSGFYYSRSKGSSVEDINKKGLKVHFHKIGEKWEEDQVIFGEGLPDSSFLEMAPLPNDGRHLIFYKLDDYSNTELWHLDLTKPGATPESITGKTIGAFYAERDGDNLYIRTNHDSQKFRIGRLKLGDKPPRIEDLEEVIGQREGIISDFRVADGTIFFTERRDMLDHVFAHSAGKTQEITLPTQGQASFLNTNTTGPFLEFESFSQPRTAYCLEGPNLRKVQGIDVGLDFGKYITEQIWTRSKDGTEISMFVTRKKDTLLDGKNPTLLYGYGGFNVSFGPSFSPSRLFWLENGGIYVISNIRGGGEFGEPWHAAGMQDKKQNVIDDFIACAEALQGLRESRKTGEKEFRHRTYTSNRHLGIMGASNGGLLTCASLVQRPELFGAVMSDVPLTDLTRFHLYPGNDAWLKELGDPRNPEHLKFLLGYSPYHHASKGQYPPIYLCTSEKDERGVDPFHAMKMAARLQANNTSDNPVLLRVRGDIGHGHGESLQQTVQRLTEQYTFFTCYLGLKVA